jgi:hypothetical protein
VASRGLFNKAELLTEHSTPARTSALLIASNPGDTRQEGICATIVSQPLDAIRCLQDVSLIIDVVFAPVDELSFATSEFFVFMKEAFPLVRRISYAGHSTDGVVLPRGTQS